jgi:hypothetical protein
MNPVYLLQGPITTYFGNNIHTYTSYLKEFKERIAGGKQSHSQHETSST